MAKKWKQGEIFVKDCPDCNGTGQGKPIEPKFILRASTEPTHEPCTTCDGEGKVEDYYEPEYNPED